MSPGENSKAGLSAQWLAVGNTDSVIRLVATDLDGTLWGPDMVVPLAHVNAIEALTRRGVTVLVATSRRPRVVRRALAEAGLCLPGVLVDGGIGIDFRTEERFHQAVFDPTDAMAALSSFRDCGLEPCLYVEHPDIDVFVSEEPSTCAAHLAYLGDVARVADLEAAVASWPLYAFCVLGLPEHRLRRVADRLAGCGMAAILYEEPIYGNYGLIVNPAGVSKWSGIDAYRRLTGVSASEVLAVGDGDNDVEMLKQAGFAVAVRRGTEGALAVADHLIDGPAQNGWASLVDLIT